MMLIIANQNYMFRPIAAYNGDLNITARFRHLYKTL